MDRFIDCYLLYDHMPDPAPDQVAQDLAMRAHALGLDLSPLPDTPGLTLAGEAARVTLTPVDVPLGAEVFMGATRGATDREAERAALLQIVGQHNAHIEISISAPRAQGGRDDRLRRLMLAHAACAAQVSEALPLALFWGPTRRLVLGKSYARLLHDDAPVDLFTVAETLADPRPGHGTRAPRLTLSGAEIYLGGPLLMRGTADMTMAELEEAARAYLEIAKDGAFDGHTFRHDGRDYRISGTRPGALRELFALPTPHAHKPKTRPTPGKWTSAA